MSSTRQVGVITSSLSKTSGWGRYSFELINEMKELVDLKVIISGDESGYNLQNVQIYALLPNPMKFSFFRVILDSFKIRKYLKDCDILHCFVEAYAPIVALANITLRKPFIITIHGGYAVRTLDGWLWGKLLRFAYKRADRILCVSKFTEKKILEKVPLENTLFIPNGVNHEKFRKTMVGDGKKEGKIILSVGAIKPSKGYDISLKAFAKVKEDVPNIKYYIVGGIHRVYYYKQLLELIKELGIQGDVYFKGNISEEEELIKLYNSSYLFILTCRTVGGFFEGFPLVYLEAGACCIPAIGTYGTGAEHAIDNGYNGLLVPQDETQKTAEAIKYLLDNPKVAKYMSENGRIKAEELSWSNITKRILKVYDEVTK